MQLNFYNHNIVLGFPSSNLYIDIPVILSCDKRKLSQKP